MDLNEITAAIVDSAIKVHTALGPGMLESVYQKCLKHELTKRCLRAESQVWVPVIYDGVEIEGAYKIDLHCRRLCDRGIKGRRTRARSSQSTTLVVPQADG